MCRCVSACVRVSKRERERDRQTDRETDRQTESVSKMVFKQANLNYYKFLSSMAVVFNWQKRWKLLLKLYHEAIFSLCVS